MTARALPERPPVEWPGARRIAGAADVARVLAAVNADGSRRGPTGGLRRAVDRADTVGLADRDGARTLRVCPEVAGLLPWPGLRRGATVASIGSAGLLLALLADAVAAGSYAAVVGMPTLSPLAAVEYGIALDRLAFVPFPGTGWTSAVGALIDGMDLVVVAGPAEVSVQTAQMLSARVRQRGCVLMPTRPWPGSDVTLQAVEQRWIGLGRGRGRLRQQELIVRAVGRGRASQPRTGRIAMPPPSIAARIVPRPGAYLSDAVESVPPLTVVPAPTPTVRLVPSATPAAPVDPWSDPDWVPAGARVVSGSRRRAG